MNRRRDSFGGWWGPQNSLQDPNGSLGRFGPYSRIGSIFNVVVCTGLTVGFFINAPAVAIFPLAMDVFFIATAVRAFRGDWDAKPDETSEAP